MTFIKNDNQPLLPLSFYTLFHSGASGGRAAPTEKIGPLCGAVAMVFCNISLAMWPLNLSLAPYLLDSDAGTDFINLLHYFNP